MNKLQKTLTVQTATMALCLLSVSNTNAEIRTIAATGEYRMGDNDTRTDAKRLALLDAKRLALEQAGTYIESITQVKNFDLSKEEIRAYTAGIVEVIEHATRTTMEGETTVVRVEVTTKIDTDVVVRQIDAIRRNVSARVELTELREANERLQLEIQAKTRELATVRSKSDVERSKQQRQRLLDRIDANELISEFSESLVKDDIAKAKKIAEQAVALHPADPVAHKWLAGVLHEQGHYDGAVREYKTALSHNPDDFGAHLGLGRALESKGDLEGAKAAYQKALRVTSPNNSVRWEEIYARFHLGNLLRKQGDFDGAIAEYRIAVRLKPNDASLHHLLAQALYENGRLDEAAQEYREWLKLDTGNEDSRATREHVQRRLRELNR